MNTDQFLIVHTDLELYRNMDKYLIASDLILAVLAISDVKSQKRLQLLVFLTWKEVFEDISYDPVFYSSGDGIFSESIENVPKTMNAKDLIEIRSIEDEFVYSITEKGQLKIREKIDSLKGDLSRLHSKMRTWVDLSIEDLQNHVRTEYPGYTGNSVQRTLKKKRDDFGFPRRHVSRARPTSRQWPHRKPAFVTGPKPMNKRFVKKIATVPTKRTIRASKNKKQTSTFRSKYTGTAWRKSTKKSKGKTSRSRKRIIFQKKR
jgi:hypothetical protein